MVDLAIFIVVISALIAFWGTFKKAGNALDKSISTAIVALDVVNETADDSMRTYQNDIRIMNGKKRLSQKEELSKLGEIPSIEDIDAMFSGLQK